MKQFVVGTYAILFFGCASAPLNEKNSYSDEIDRKTVSVLAYDGMYNVMDAYATLLDKEILNSQLQRKVAFYKWPDTKLRDEREKAIQDESQSTKFFLSFYTPDSRYDDLNKTKTIWKIFLEVDGRQFDATVEKASGTLIELQSLYPFHSRWSTGYILTFPVPTDSVAGHPCKLIISSPLATKAFAFNRPESQ